MSEIATGTNGGGMGMSGRQVRLALVLLAGFLAVLTLITIGNAESMISDFEAARVPFTVRHVWIWQVTSVVAWALVMVPIWMVTARFWPPRIGWGGIVAVFLGGLFVASSLHIGLTIGFRKLVYWAWEGATYRFQGGLAHPYVYEFRKDVATYLQFVLFALICQWLLARVGQGTPAPLIVRVPEDRFLDVSDGGAVHRVPVAAIGMVTAAGNYVEIVAKGRTLLHRATLAMMESELGEGFVRIHRSRLINRAAVRRIETNQSGDFEVEMADGQRVKGSRRYRAGLEA